MSANATSLLVLAALASGCGFHSISAATGDGSDDGGDHMQVVDAAGLIDGQGVDDGCLRDDVVTVCFTEQPSVAVVVPTGVIDTDHSPMCSTKLTPGSIAACVIAGTTVTVPGGATVGAMGARPLVFAATDTIIISGMIDVAAHMTGPQAIGPGVLACTPGTLPMPGGSGGGAGGSFGSLGGGGGADSSAKPGGTPAAVIASTTLHGGCPGQLGAASGGGTNGLGGGAGGAIALLAKASIVIDGTINASGGGGFGESGAGGGRGGGGGGAGGMIVIDAPVVTGANPKIYANGGSGGEGAGGNSSRPGADANIDPTVAALGGAGGSSGGDGGAGAINDGANASAAGLGLVGNPGGGGGGGGGVGVVRKFKTTTALPGTVSPPAT